MGVAGLLLTGGTSSRFGQDKGAFVVPGQPGSLAHRTAGLLADVTRPALEVGPGYSELPALVEDPPGQGPLVAIAAGVQRLRALGWAGPAIVLATDLPLLSRGFLAWLAGYPGGRSVIPVVGGLPQPLCARYAAPDLGSAVELAVAGRRAMRDLLNDIDAALAGPEEWATAAGGSDVLTDIDTPSDLARLRACPS
jgi:molybdopterin-guanine dinucleotide biosynthesis protein A